MDSVVVKIFPRLKKKSRRRNPSARLSRRVRHVYRHTRHVCATPGAVPYSPCFSMYARTPGASASCSSSASKSPPSQARLAFPGAARNAALGEHRADHRAGDGLAHLLDLQHARVWPDAHLLQAIKTSLSRHDHLRARALERVALPPLAQPQVAVGVAAQTPREVRPFVPPPRLDGHQHVVAPHRHRLQG